MLAEPSRNNTVKRLPRHFGPIRTIRWTVRAKIAMSKTRMAIQTIARSAHARLSPRAFSFCYKREIAHSYPSNEVTIMYGPRLPIENSLCFGNREITTDFGYTPLL